MSTVTPNLGLTKPDYTDPRDIAVINTNMDIVDTKLKSPYIITSFVTQNVMTNDRLVHSAITIPPHSICVIIGNAALAKGSGGATTFESAVLINQTSSSDPIVTIGQFGQVAAREINTVEQWVTGRTHQGVESVRYVTNTTDNPATWYVHTHTWTNSEAHHQYGYQAVYLGYA